MNASVHRKLVLDAISFMNTGNLKERQALWRLTQLAQNENELLKILCEKADKTDEFSDLQFYVPFPVMTDYAVYNNYHATGLLHYLNAFLVPVNWDLANGYHFLWSSQTTLDEEFHSFWIDFFNVNIEDDPNKSLVLGRVPPYWTGQTQTWEDNWAKRLPFSEYPPCSAVAATYYGHLINHYYDLMQVNIYGNEPNLLELEKLGPVLHFMGDVIVPQHIRGAHGFCHVEWEQTAEQLINAGMVGLDAQLVRNLLSEKPFEGWFWQGGPLDGIYAVDYTIVGVADMTLSKIMSATNTDINSLWDQGDDFWKSFLITQSTGSASPATSSTGCMKYFYNLGVAACVHTLMRASEDLLLRNIGPVPPQFFIENFIFSEVTLVQLFSRFSARKSRKRKDSKLKPSMLYRSKLRQGSQLKEQLDIFEQNFSVRNLSEINSHRLTESVNSLQSSIEQELLDHRNLELGTNEDELTNFTTNFGPFAYRSPTMEECINEQKMSHYLELSDIHKYKIHLLYLTRNIAVLNAVERRKGVNPEIENKRREIMELREQSITSKSLPRIQRLPLSQEICFINHEGRSLPENIRKR